MSLQDVTDALGSVGDFINQGISTWDGIFGRAPETAENPQSNPPAPAMQATSPNADLSEPGMDRDTVILVAVVLIAVVVVVLK